MYRFAYALCREIAYTVALVCNSLGDHRHRDEAANVCMKLERMQRKLRSDIFCVQEITNEYSELMKSEWSRLNAKY